MKEEEAKKEKSDKKANQEKLKAKPKKKTSVSEWKDKSIDELRLEYQKLSISIKIGEELDTSLQKKLRKEIARALAKERQEDKN